MCGIIGFIGHEAAAPIVLDGLRKLEYRGYDSAGIASISSDILYVAKDVGKLYEVDQKHGLGQLPGEVAIGHVRWATHGAVTHKNAHPHLDCHGKLALVHNGIVDNYHELRYELEARHCFVSKTDTEVICHLLEDKLAEGCVSLEEAVLKTLPQIKGSSAFAVISLNEPNKIVGARKGGPLVVGVGKGFAFLASDSLSFLEHTNRAIFLEDEEVAVVTPRRVGVLDREGKKIKRRAQRIDWGWEEATKGQAPYFMLKEIEEQPQVIEKALAQNKRFLMEIALDILRAKDVVITACGTSRYAALIGRYLFSKLGGKFCDVVISSEFQYFADSIDRNTVVIAVSQSGETADVIEGVKRAKEAGARVISIVNVRGSQLCRISDRVVYINCGPEICVAATKSFVGQLVIFYLLAFAMSNRLVQGMKELRELSGLIADNLRENGARLEELVEKFKDHEHFYYIARGPNFAIATEGALKLKEISYIHAEGMPAGELKHGTLALIEEGAPVVVLCPQDYTYSETHGNALETKARGAFLIGVSDVSSEAFDYWIRIPKVKEIFYPLMEVVPLQLLAYHLAVAREKDPDRPRNLAKSVTVK